MKPGTTEFRKALLSSLEKESRERSLGPVFIDSEVWASRNTIVYRCRIGDRRAVAKAQSTKPGEVVEAEYHMLLDMADKFRDRSSRGLRPLALFPELGVLVTEEENGTPLRALVETACQGSKRAWVDAASGVESAAKALRRFHDAFGERSDPDSKNEAVVRWYMDYSPKNVLVQSVALESEEPHVVLMDPPEKEEWRPRTEDIGGFCYDMTRIRFLPRFIWKPSVSGKIDWFKAKFIRGYFQMEHERFGATVLERIKEAEYRRATQALRWYMRPWRYRSVLKETLRLCYLGPLTAGYRASGIHKSHANVRRLLDSNGETEWQPSLDS